MMRRETDLFDYLAEEVINHESPEMVDVLRRVANLPWIVRDLAEYLGFDMVDRLLGSELRPVFTAELDTPPRAVTITPLLTEYFTSRLPLPKSELVPFKSRAAQWYQQVGAFPRHSTVSWRPKLLLRCSGHLFSPTVMRCLLAKQSRRSSKRFKRFPVTIGLRNSPSSRQTLSR